MRYKCLIKIGFYIKMSKYDYLLRIIKKWQNTITRKAD